MADFYYEWSVDSGGVQVDIYGDDSDTIYYQIFIRRSDEQGAVKGYPKWVKRKNYYTGVWCSLDEGEYVMNVGWNTTGSGSVTWLGATDAFYIEESTPPPTQRGYINDYDVTKTSITIYYDSIDNAEWYEIAYRVNGSQDSTTIYDTTTRLRYTISGLSPNTQYIVNYRGCNGSGDGPYMRSGKIIKTLSDVGGVAINTSSRTNWVRYVPYINTRSGWRKASPYINTRPGWRKGNYS